MKSRTTIKFRKALRGLPPQIQQQARQAYRQFMRDPWHPSLRFKQVHNHLPIYSARINRSYRAVGQWEGDTVIWFWIGDHTAYEKLLTQL